MGWFWKTLYFLKYRSKAKKLLFIECSELNFACGTHSTKIQKNLFFCTFKVERRVMIKL